MPQVEARIPNRRRDMATVAAMTERFGTEHKIPSAVVNDLNVALDEILSNIISYGYAPEEQSEIVVRLAIRGGAIIVDVEDSGRPFDPLRVAPPDLSKPLRDRKVGGLGIHFVKTLMDGISYQRTHGRNQLRLIRKLRVAS